MTGHAYLIIVEPFPKTPSEESQWRLLGAVTQHAFVQCFAVRMLSKGTGMEPESAISEFRFEIDRLR
jgi:hypothetical protein